MLQICGSPEWASPNSGNQARSREEPSVTIWADGDALPATARDLLFRAAQRLGVSLVMVANKPLRVPDSPYLSTVLVEAGADVADHWIVERAEPGDLVVTADIPLASRVVTKGAEALDPRGSSYTEQNVRERLALRDLMADLRGADMITGGGPPPYTKKDAQRFANALNGFLNRPTKKAT
jgi:uncharacterized protein YaiI (UPF0178 family)